MHEETEKIEDIDRITMYKMIRALHRYDYFITKCFVNELLKRRNIYSWYKVDRGKI